MKKLKNIRNVRAFTREKDIFCIEGNWETDHRDAKSVRKALEFLKSIEKVNSIVKECSNKVTLEEHISSSMQNRYKKYSILYLAFHGAPGVLKVGKRNGEVSLVDIADMIGGKANGKIIHFGSCETLDVSTKEINDFLYKTKALAVSGYKKEVDFVKSTVFDLIYFQQCQQNFDIRLISNNMKKYYNNLGKELGFVLKYWQ